MRVPRNKPLPASVKTARGTLRKHRQRGVIEIAASSPPPVMPTWLTKAGEATWLDNLDRVMALGMAAEPDSDIATWLALVPTHGAAVERHRLGPRPKCAGWRNVSGWLGSGRESCAVSTPYPAQATRSTRTSRRTDLGMPPPTSAIDRLRAVAAREAAIGDPEGFAGAVAEYESGARLGLRLDEVLNLSVSRWWATEALAQRDALVQQLAASFFTQEPSGVVASALARYAASIEWRNARAYRSPPTGTSERHRLCFQILKLGDAPSARTVRRILARSGHVAPHGDGQSTSATCSNDDDEKAASAA
jgi:hypothetical protein